MTIELFLSFNQMELDLVKTLLLLLALWMLSWIPYTIMSLWILLFDAKNLTPELAFVPTLLCKFSATLNNFIYVVR